MQGVLIGLIVIFAFCFLEVYVQVLLLFITVMSVEIKNSGPRGLWQNWREKNSTKKTRLRGTN